MTLEQECVLWADRHWPECHAAMSRGDRRHYLKCCGAVVRRRTQDEGFEWLYERIVQDAEEFLRLAPYVGSFTAHGVEVPGDLGFRDWAMGIRMVFDAPRIPLSYVMQGEQKSQAAHPRDTLDKPAKGGKLKGQKSKPEADGGPTLF